MWLLMMLSAAQAAEFNPDRPGFSDSTGLVPRGSLMTEAGVALDVADGSSTVSAPALLVRGGLNRHLELRVATPSLSFPLADSAQAAVGEAAVGLKTAAAVGDIGFSVVGMLPTRPAASVEDGLGPPTFNANVSAPFAELYSWTLNGVITPTDPPGWAASLAVGRSIGDSGGAYVQGAALPGSALVGIGGTLLLLPQLQLDLYVDALPFDGAAQIGAGIARQW